MQTKLTTTLANNQRSLILAAMYTRRRQQQPAEEQLLVCDLKPMLCGAGSSHRVPLFSSSLGKLYLLVFSDWALSEI